MQRRFLLGIDLNFILRGVNVASIKQLGMRKRIFVIKINRINRYRNIMYRYLTSILFINFVIMLKSYKIFFSLS